MHAKFLSHVWAVIHLSAFNYRSGQEEEYKNFYNHLGNILGCTSCIDDYKNFIKMNPPDFGDLFGWTVKLHNHVNTIRGEPTYTRKESFEYWRTH
jgi:hypothetical protein